MAGYLLNLSVAMPTSASTADGQFNSESADPLSRKWFQVPPTWPGSAYAQGASVTQPGPVANWPQTRYGFPVADTGNFSCYLSDDIYIRVVADSSWGKPVVVTVNVVFGRPATSTGSGEIMATPFVLQSGFGVGQNAPCAYFAWPPSVPTATDGSWIYYMGKPSQNAVGQAAANGSSDAGRLCTYSFVVGAFCGFVPATPSNGYTYGHDPRMAVQG